MPPMGGPGGAPFFGNLIFIIVIGTILYMLFRRFATWASNNGAEVATTQARVMAKRSYHHHNSTSYYVTFEFPNGDRREFRVYSREFGLLAEQDIGVLKCQGTRFLSFERRH